MIADKKSDAGENAGPRAKKPVDYIREARTLLRDGEKKEAYRVLLQATMDYPGEPHILSYFGCLQAVVDRKFRSGIENCRKALVMFKAADSYSAGVTYPILYLNLGRAYLAAGKKKEAVDAFNKGMHYDKSHSELRKELRLLGVRKKPVIAFLDRANPINKYLGMLLHGSREAKQQTRR